MKFFIKDFLSKSDETCSFLSEHNVNTWYYVIISSLVVIFQIDFIENTWFNSG